MGAHSPYYMKTDYILLFYQAFVKFKTDLAYNSDIPYRLHEAKILPIILY